MMTGQEMREQLLTAMPVTERRLVLAGVPTAVLEGGEGPPIVLLHGPGEFAATWLRVVPELTRTHRVIAPDLPGHGESGLPAEGLDSERVLRWLGELIERTCPTPPVLVGHLLGGAIAARFAAAHGDRISRLVLVDSYGLARLRPSPKYTLAMIGFVARPNGRSQRRLFQQCFADPGRVREQLGAQWEPLGGYGIDRARAATVKSAMRSLMPQFGMPAIPSEELDRISVPTSLIWGRDDTHVRLRTGEAASARHGWPLRVIDGAADDPSVEQPEAFLGALHEALA